MRSIVRDAAKVDERYVQLFEVDAVDERCEGEDFDDDFILSEAQDVLSRYYEIGHINQEMLSGQNGPEEKKIAKREVRQLQRFLAKYSQEVAQ